MRFWSSKNHGSICLNVSSPRSFLVCLCYFCSPKLQSQRPSKRISSAFRGQTTLTEEEGLESLGVASKHWQKPAWTDMKGPNGVEWYNVIIIILAVIGVFVNTCSLVVLIKKRKNSMFYKLLKVNFLRLRMKSRESFVRSQVVLLKLIKFT